MRVDELLGASGVCPGTCMELLRQAELHKVTDARTFLLKLRQWSGSGGDMGVVWALRRAYNAAHAPRDRLWVPLTHAAHAAHADFSFTRQR